MWEALTQACVILQRDEAPGWMFEKGKTTLEETADGKEMLTTEGEAEAITIEEGQGQGHTTGHRQKRNSGNTKDNVMDNSSPGPQQKNQRKNATQHGHTK